MDYMTAGGIEPTAETARELDSFRRNTIWHQRLVLDLARFFDVEPELDTIIQKRNQALANGYTEYVRLLYQVAGLSGAVMDFGFPLPQIEVAEVQQQLPLEVVPIYRIEPLIVELLAQDLSWSEFRHAFDDRIAEAIEDDGFRGLKTIIAYRTGLQISPLSRSPDQGQQALDAIRRGLGGGSMKMLRDHLVCRAMERCIEYDIPMQIHTGMGDHEVNLALARPSYLLDLLRFPAFRACHVILVHTGYPFHAEAGYIAGVLPRVYCDIGEGTPFAAHAAPRILREVMEMAPWSKILYSSDGYSVPEINYSSALIGKQAVSQVLTQLVHDGWMTNAKAKVAAEAILAGNARRLYGFETA
jgi:uncharacterized protein